MGVRAFSRDPSAGGRIRERNDKTTGLSSGSLVRQPDRYCDDTLDIGKHLPNFYNHALAELWRSIDRFESNLDAIRNSVTVSVNNTGERTSVTEAKMAGHSNSSWSKFHSLRSRDSQSGV